MKSLKNVARETLLIMTVALYAENATVVCVFAPDKSDMPVYAPLIVLIADKHGYVLPGTVYRRNIFTLYLCDNRLKSALVARQ